MYKNNIFEKKKKKNLFPLSKENTFQLITDNKKKWGYK